MDEIKKNKKEMNSIDKLNSGMKWLAVSMVICTIIATLGGNGGIFTSMAADESNKEFESLRSEFNSLSDTVYNFLDDVNSHNKVDVFDGSLLTWTKSGTTLTGQMQTSKLIMKGVSKVTRIDVDFRSDMTIYDLTPSYDLNSKKGILTITVPNVPDELGESLSINNVTVFSRGVH